MRLLALGDMHLDETLHPSLEKNETTFDAVVGVGDVTNRDTTNPDIGREVLAQLAVTVGPVVYVPGNHDYEYRSILTDAEDVHDVQNQPFKINNVRFYGVGSDRFNDGPEIPYLQHPDLSSDPELVDEWVAATQSKCANYTERSVERVVRPESVRPYLSYYENKYRDFCECVSDESSTEILVTHVPPFNTSIDQITNEKSPLYEHHWGSIALRHCLRTISPKICISGHIHGSKGVTTVEDTLCVNPGYRGAYCVRISSAGVEVTEIGVQYQ